MEWAQFKANDDCQTSCQIYKYSSYVLQHLQLAAAFQQVYLEQ